MFNKIKEGSTRRSILGADRDRAVVRALLAATAAIVLGAPGAAAAAQATSHTPSKEIVDAMVEQFGLTPTQARARIIAEGEASDIRESAQRAAGDAFAGAYFDAALGVLVVAISDRAAFDAVSATGAQPRLVSTSYTELERELHELDSRTTLQPREVTGWGIDEIANTVVVDVVGGPTDAVRTFVAGLAHVRVNYYQPPVATMADLIGGMEITGSTSKCSLGFNALDGAGSVYVITAGHCVDSNGRDWSGWAGKIGTTPKYDSSFPGDDYGRILRTETNWVPTPKIAGTATVLGKGVAAIGTTVCRSGKTTGLKCGTIQATNQTIDYGSVGGPVYGLTKTSACAGEGDSGGPFISSTRQAQGVLSGGGTNCVKGWSYFQPLNEILNAYDLKLVVDPAGSITK